METLKGYVNQIIFRNPDNGYTVFEMVYEDTELTCVGTFPVLNEGENIKVEGEYTNHPTYGKQFAVRKLEECEPEDETAIERYLGSGAIKGVGMSLAARIVRRFKRDSFRIIEEEPERLAEVKGISLRKAQEISAQVAEKRELRQAMIFLQKFGISLNLAIKIYNKYQQDIYQIMKENPYFASGSFRRAYISAERRVDGKDSRLIGYRRVLNRKTLYGSCNRKKANGKRQQPLCGLILLYGICCC